MKICELIEDYGLVGFETLAVEVQLPVCTFESKLAEPIVG